MTDKKLALITIHGMGKVKPQYYAGLENKLKRKLGNDWSKISFQNIHYAEALQKPQDKLWWDIKKTRDNDIDATKLRQFFLFSFGDAATLEYSGHKDKKKYLEVQVNIQSALKKAYLDLGEDKSKPVVLIAHSLGCQIISNYLWDAGKTKNIFKETQSNKNLFEFLQLKSMTNLVTTGCNIPLFVSGLDDRVCFNKPNTKLKWDNYYDPDDVLGWPLRQLGDSYKFIKDHHINAGGLLTSWNPLSHGKYWTDNDLIRPLVNKLMNHIN